MELKPKKSSFLLSRLAPPLALLAVATAVGATWLRLAYSQGPAMAAVAGAVLIAGVLVWAALVAYGKERYLFCDHQIVRYSGGPLSDRQTELNIRNITHVQVVLPWLRHRFFHVGNIAIDSAGSGEAMQLRLLREPEVVAEQVRRLMQRNGFSLRHSRRLHEEQPARVGVALEIAGMALGAVGFLFFTLPPASAVSRALPSPWNVLAVTALFVLGPLVVTGYLVVHSFDLKRRTYTVYDDAVLYTEGFLTRNNAFIPAENIADANTRQSLLERLLGLYHVTVSCQGSGQEVRFRHLLHGPQLNAAVDVLARSSGPAAASAEGDGATAEAAAEAAAAGGPARAATGPPAGPMQAHLIDESVTGTLRMHRVRAIAPHVLSAVVLVTVALLVAEIVRAAGQGGGVAVSLGMAVAAFWIGGAVRGVLAAFYTRFEMRPRSVKRIYRFTSTEETEFSSDKLTGVAWSEGPLDRLFGTCTMRFWSIGSDETLDFRHVGGCDSAEILDRALAKAGIRSDQTIYTMPSTWSLPAALAAGLVGHTFAVAAAGGFAMAAVLVSGWFAVGVAAVGAGWAAALAYQPVYYRRCRAIFGDRHVEVHRGVFIRSREHALYDNVKHITTVRYPTFDCGTLIFSIAGQGPFTAFTVDFVDGITIQDNLIDLILQRVSTGEALPQIEAQLEVGGERPVRVSLPNLGNTLVPLIASSVVLFPLVVLLPLTIAWAVVAVRRRRYVIESYRVLACWGIVYRRQRSVIFGKIDHIRQSQGAMNKLFGNGNVLLYTAGSSTEDLAVRNVPDYQAFYADLRAQYTSETPP